MRGSESLPGFTVKVFVEEDSLVPCAVAPKKRAGAEHGPPSLGIAQEDADETALDLISHRAKMHPLSRARRQLDGEAFPEALMQMPQRLERQKIERKPDGAAPVRIAAEERGPRFRG